MLISMNKIVLMISFYKGTKDKCLSSIIFQKRNEKNEKKRKEKARKSSTTVLNFDFSFLFGIINY